MNIIAYSRPLRDVCELEKGKPPLQTPYNGLGAERYLTPDFLRGKAEPEDARPSSDAIRVRDGETIILWDGSNAGEVLRARDGMLASTMMRVRHHSSYDTSYFYYALKAWEYHLKGQTGGSGIPHVDKEILGGLSLFHCKKLEQTKIAEILSTVDQAIEQTEALIAKQQRIKTGLMQDLLTHGIDENGNLRSEETHEFKDSPLGRIPVEWEVKEIQELLTDVNPSMRSGPFGSILLKEELMESGIPLLGIDNVLPEEFVPFFKRFVTPKKARQLKKFRVRPRDVMITIMGTVGRCCMVPDNIGEALSSKHVWTISFDEKVYSPYLACLQINYSPWVLNHFEKDMQGGIMASIRSETLRSTRLPVPPLEETRAIEDRIRAISTDLCANQALLRKLNSLKTALMQDLLTGKVPVTPLLTEEERSA